MLKTLDRVQLFRASTLARFLTPPARVLKLVPRETTDAGAGSLYFATFKILAALVLKSGRDEAPFSVYDSAPIRLPENAGVKLWMAGVGDAIFDITYGNEANDWPGDGGSAISGVDATGQRVAIRAAVDGRILTLGAANPLYAYNQPLEFLCTNTAWTLVLAERPYRVRAEIQNNSDLGAAPEPLAIAFGDSGAYADGIKVRPGETCTLETSGPIYVRTASALQVDGAGTIASGYEPSGH